MPFQAKCLFCGQGVKAPDHALGASVRCRRCANHFTLAPMEEAIAESPRGPGRRTARANATASVSAELTDVPEADTLPTTPRYSATTPENPPEPLHLSDLLGVAALMAAGGALLCASSRSWAALVLPIGGGSVLIGLLALLVAWSLGRRSRLPAIGATTAVAALLLAWLFPSLLGQAYWMSRQSAPAINMEIRAVPLTAADARGTAAGEDWVNAAHSAIQQGPLRVWLGSVRRVPVTAAEDTPPKKDDASGDLLVIRIRIQMVEDARRFAGHQAQPSMSRGDDLQPRLIDKVGRSLPRREVEKVAMTDNTIRSNMFPVSVEDRTFAFAVLSGSQDLRFEIPAEPLGGKGMFRFTIPASMMRRDAGGDLRGEPTPNR